MLRDTRPQRDSGDMQHISVQLPVPGADATLDVVRHGHWGRPVLVFPVEGGRAGDFVAEGMLASTADLVEAGRVSFFCVDSLDEWTWSDTDLPTEERAIRHGVYHHWLEDQVVPWIHEECGGPQQMITVGMSFGAYHAVQFAMQRADLAPVAIGLSGSYDPTKWDGWGELGEAAYLANPTAYVQNLHGDHLQWLRAQLSVLLVVGEGEFEVTPTQALPSTRQLAHLLEEKGIRHELDVWGHDSGHEWWWWQRQLARHLPRFV